MPLLLRVLRVDCCVIVLVEGAQPLSCLLSILLLLHLRGNIHISDNVMNVWSNTSFLGRRSLPLLPDRIISFLKLSRFPFIFTGVFGSEDCSSTRHVVSVFTAKEMDQIPDFVEDLEHKFAALSQDMMPSLQSYLQESDLAKIGSENVPITPSPSSGANTNIPQRKGSSHTPNSCYDDEILNQDQDIKSQKQKASVHPAFPSVQALKKAEPIDDSSSSRSDLSNGTSLTKIEVLQAELQAVDDEQQQVRNFKDFPQNLPEPQRFTAKPSHITTSTPPLNVPPTGTKKESVKKVHWFTYKDNSNSHPLCPVVCDVPIREQLAGSPGFRHVRRLSEPPRTTVIGLYPSLVEGPTTVFEQMPRTNSTMTVTATPGGEIQTPAPQKSQFVPLVASNSPKPPPISPDVTEPIANSSVVPTPGLTSIFPHAMVPTTPTVASMPPSPPPTIPSPKSTPESITTNPELLETTFSQSSSGSSTESVIWISPGEQKCTMHPFEVRHKPSGVLNPFTSPFFTPPDHASDSSSTISSHELSDLASMLKGEYEPPSLPSLTRVTDRSSTSEPKPWTYPPFVAETPEQSNVSIHHSHFTTPRTVKSFSRDHKKHRESWRMENHDAHPIKEERTRYKMTKTPEKEDDSLSEWLNRRMAQTPTRPTTMTAPPLPPPSPPGPSSPSSSSNSSSSSKSTTTTTTDNHSNESDSTVSSNSREQQTKSRKYKKKKSKEKKDAKKLKKKKTKDFKKHAILFSKLCKTAKCNNQSILKLDTEPTQRRRALVRWLKRLNDTLKMHYQTYDILERYPQLPKKVDKTTNKALASFLKAYMAPSVIAVLAGADPDNGLLIIHRLQQLYASTTLEDKLRAQDHLQNMQMHPKELITSFISRFRRAIQGVYDASQNPEHLSELYLINLFLVKTLNAIPMGSDIRNTLLDYKRMIKRAKDPESIPFILADMEYEVSQQENNANLIAKTKSYRRESANVASTTSAKRRAIRCFFCGGNHRLHECRKCSKEEKKKLWEKHGVKSKRRKPTRISSANAADEQPKESTTAYQKPTKESKSSHKEMASTAVRIPNSSHPKVTFATMAKVTSISDEANYNDDSKFSLLSQWLIDSGCSTHMTPFAEDLITDHESTDSVVEVANGNIVKAKKRGTALVQIIDIDTNKAYNIYLEGVLHVPGISRRLFSVTCWTQCGGSISFHGDKCKLKYANPASNTGVTTATILAPFTQYPAPGHYIHPIAAIGKEKVEIPSDLLH